MEHRTLGRSGLKVSRLTLGAMTFGASRGFMRGVTSSDQEARRVLDAALDAGITTIDTSNNYSEGHSEELLGSWLQGRRHRVVLATKCRFPTSPESDWPNGSGLSRKSIVENCEASLRRLRTDWIDLYQVHMQDGSVPIEETLRALDDLIRAGKIRYAGCSNYTGYRLAEALWVADRRNLSPFVSLQLQWSLIVRDAERELIPAARAFGLGTLIWSPLARGFLSGKYVRGQPPPPGSRLEAWKETMQRYDDDRCWGVVEAVRTVAERRGTTPAAVALAWLLHQPETTSIIVGARTADQLEENLQALEVRLDAADLAELDAASRPQWGYPYDFIGSRERW